MRPAPNGIAAAESNGVCQEFHICWFQVVFWVGEEVVERELEVDAMAGKWEFMPVKKGFWRFGRFRWPAKVLYQSSGIEGGC